jgi:DMSO/TMAO reductase YedYZ molybdopterin-dependent catalytic subunit
MKKHYLTLKVTLFLFLISFHFVVAQNEKQLFIKVEGEVTKPLTLTMADLSKMKRADASMKDRDGKNYKYSGVPVTEILKEAGVTIGKELRGENLSKYLLVKAADGYEVLFSLAELDSSFTDRIVILADQQEGKLLPAGKGPFRMVVPGEKKPARCVFEVTHLIIRFAKE